VTGALDGIFRPLAVGLINKFGTTAILRRRTSAFDVTTGKTTDTDADIGVFITPPAPYEQRRDGGNTVGITTSCTVAGQGLAIVPTALTDHLVHAGKQFQVLEVVRVYSGNLVAAYKLLMKE
jgi:hypothetical protein